MDIHSVISSINFGILSDEDVLNGSVAEINDPNYNLSNNRNEMKKTLNDPRLGAIKAKVKCETCDCDLKTCTGHFGHIVLNQPIVNPLFYSHLLLVLKCICISCRRLRISEERICENKFHLLSGYLKFKAISDYLDTVKTCLECHQQHVKTVFDDTTADYYHVSSNGSSETKTLLTTKEIEDILGLLSDDDIEILGFTKNLNHPKNYIMNYFPVLPPVSRISLSNGENTTVEEDLTIHLSDIIKINNNLAKEGADIKKLMENLKGKIATFFNNSNEKSKHHRSGKATKGIKERLGGKNGIFRKNLMGKRVNFSARTVIGPDPTLKMDEIAIPPEIAKNLYIPIHVNELNLEEVRQLNREKKIVAKITEDFEIINTAKKFKLSNLNFGDILIRDGKEQKVLNLKDTFYPTDKFARNGKIYDIEIEETILPDIFVGDIVHRKLQDGDTVILNRQPTLHRASMQAVKIIIRPGKTIRMNLAITKPFNADFDGDEMNIHIPMSMESIVECEELATPYNHLISVQTSKPNIVIVQDALLGAFHMTRRFTEITKSQFFQILMKTDIPQEKILQRMNTINSIMSLKGKKANCFTGRGIISMFLPYDFNYEYTNKASITEPTVKIYKGVLYEGAFDKNIIGGGDKSIQQLLFKEYSKEIAGSFINNIQFVAYEWLMIFGFSVGLGDCFTINKDEEEKAKDSINKYLLEAEHIKSITCAEQIKETRISAALNKAKDIGMRISKDALSEENNFVKTCTAGSKGDYFNICQITGLLGQQNIYGRRVKKELSNQTRTLPHYPFKNLTPLQENESRGFISSSFLKGLNPREYFFHSMSGREGVCSTSISTSSSGYTQRRIIKLNEDIKVWYDNTVRDSSGRIYQMAYNGDSLDPSSLIRVNGELELMDVGRIVDRINMNLE